MSDLFLTADLHLGHANIIKYCNRPFKTEEEMTETIIKKWNERITEDDTVIHNGDFCFKNSNEIRGEGVKKKANFYKMFLNGNIVFIKGNHDKNNSMNTHIQHLVLNWGGKEYWVTHRPEDYNPRYEINFVGHVHEHWRFKKMGGCYLINVGVDVCNFYPMTIGEHLNKFHHWRKHLGGETS